MTCREKLKLEYPWLCGHGMGGCDGCPSDYGYMSDPKCCEDTTCRSCWDREIPEEKEKDMLLVGDEVVEHPDTDINKGNMCAEFNRLRKEHLDKNSVPTGINLSLDSDNRAKIICISGKAQHGKDTSAGYLKEFLEEKGKRVLIAHYGDLVKYVCRTFFDWDGNKDKIGRSLLQRVGTDQIRAKTPNFWVKFVKDIVDHFPNEWDYVLIPDCRFPNEIDYFDGDYIVVHIRVFRTNFVSPLTIEQQKHISETALDSRIPDYMLYNGFGLEELREAVREVGEKLIKEAL